MVRKCTDMGQFREDWPVRRNIDKDALAAVAHLLMTLDIAVIGRSHMTVPGPATQLAMPSGLPRF